MDTDANKISQRIRNLLNARGIQQGEIARALRVSKQYLSHCLAIDPETGDFRRKDPYIREGIAHHLGLTYREAWEEPKPCYRKPDYPLHDEGNSNEPVTGM